MRLAISKKGKFARRRATKAAKLTAVYSLDGTTKAEDNTQLRMEAHHAAEICHRRAGADYGA